MTLAKGLNNLGHMKHVKKRNKKNIKLSQSIIEVTLGIATLFFAVIFLQSSLNNLDIRYGFTFVKGHTQICFISMLVLSVVLAWLVSFFGSFLAGEVFFLTIILVLSIATKIKIQFRQEAIYPEDLKMINQIELFKDIVGEKLIYILMGILFLVIIAGIFLLIRSFRFSYKLQWVRLTVFSLSTVLLFLIWNFNIINSPVRVVVEKQVGNWIMWDQTKNYEEKGFVPGFLYNLKSKAMEKPENYSKEAVLEIVEKYKKEAEDANKLAIDEKPNIVYIMNESFSDMKNLQGISLSEDPIEEYNQIAQNTYSGFMVSPQYGGGTANVEFEALTSFPMEMLNPQISVPYSSLIPNYDKFPSVVSFLNSNGYESLAIHPFNTSMYKRKEVYKTFEFDTFLSSENTLFNDVRKDTMYYSDNGAYGVTFEKLQQSDEPQFIHLVTMQNHSPYTSSFSDKIYTVNGQTTGELANYAQAVHESSVAIQTFLNNLNQLNKRTIVVFWGDHLPPIYSEDILSQNDEIVKFETPFFIYDSQNEINTTSNVKYTSPIYFTGDLLQRANLKCSGFYQLLNDLKDYLPSFKRGSYYYNNEWHNQINLNQNQQYLDLKMIQYDIFSRNNYSLAAGFFE